MNNLIEIKRKSLETFIREQMIGPNGCRGRFSIEMEVDKPFEGEVINTTPGSIYSTAVLFPPKAQGMFRPQESSDDSESGDETISTDGQEDDGELLRSDSNEQNGDLGSDVDDEDVYSLSRRFPNTVGISCCVQSAVSFQGYQSFKCSVHCHQYSSHRFIGHNNQASNQIASATC